MSDKQKIYNRFKFISDVPEFTIEDIKEIRHTLGLSQSMFSKILGVPHGQRKHGRLERSNLTTLLDGSCNY